MRRTRSYLFKNPAQNTISPATKHATLPTAPTTAVNGPANNKNKKNAQRIKGKHGRDNPVKPTFNDIFQTSTLNQEQVISNNTDEDDEPIYMTGEDIQELRQSAALKKQLEEEAQFLSTYELPEQTPPRGSLTALKKTLTEAAKEKIAEDRSLETNNTVLVQQFKRMAIHDKIKRHKSSSDVSNSHAYKVNK